MVVTSGPGLLVNGSVARDTMGLVSDPGWNMNGTMVIISDKVRISTEAPHIKSAPYPNWLFL